MKRRARQVFARNFESVGSPSQSFCGNLSRLQDPGAFTPVMGFCIPPTLRAGDQRVAVGPSPASADPRLLEGQVPALVGSASSAAGCRWLAAASFAAARSGRQRAAGAVAGEVAGGEQFLLLVTRFHSVITERHRRSSGPEGPVRQAISRARS